MSNTNDYTLPTFQFEIEEEEYDKAVIKVIGIGGGGGNAVSHMLQKGIEGVQFCAANTDVQALSKIEKIFSSVRQKNDTLPYFGIKLGEQTTRGLGAGARPDIGQKAVQESIESIKEYLEGSDMVFITAGMGGGTGTGGASVVASLAKQMGILTVGVVTKPFSFEGKPRSRNAEQGIKALAEHVDSLIIIPNEKLVQNMGKNTSLTECFEKANDVLYNAVHGISDLITRPGIINVDFADVKTVMSSMGMTMMGTGIASGEDRASEATKKAINSPLLEHVDIKGAKGILVNIIADDSLSIGEFNEIGAEIREYADPDANIVIGSSFDPDMKEEIMITLVATGVESTYNENKSRAVNSDQVSHQSEHAQPRIKPEATNYADHMVKHSGEPQESSAPPRGGFNEPSRGFEEPRMGSDDIGNTRVVKSEQLSDQERREMYNNMKQKKRKGLGGLLGMRKDPDLSEEPERDYREEPAPLKEERYPEEPRHGFGISAREDEGLRAPAEERPQATRPEPARTGVSKFLSRKG